MFRHRHRKRRPVWGCRSRIDRRCQDSRQGHEEARSIFRRSELPCEPSLGTLRAMGFRKQRMPQQFPRCGFDTLPVVQRSWLLLLPVLVLTSVAFGGLEWDKHEVTVGAKAQEQVVKASFAFSVTGKIPVSIDSAETGCDCVVAKSANGVYQPADKGKLELTLTVGDREGTYSRPVIVKGHLADRPFVHSLTLTVRVPQILKFSRRVLTWPAGDLSEKSVDVECLEAVDLLPAVAPSGYKLSTDHQAGSRQYKLRVQPTAPVAGRAAILLQGKIGEGPPRSWQVFLIQDAATTSVKK